MFPLSLRFSTLISVMLTSRALCVPAADAVSLPAAASHAVDFEKEVRPIFEARCVKCHGEEKQKGGFRVDLKRSVLTGGDNYAPNVLPGKSADSPLIRFVAGLDADMKMPSKGDPLTSEQIGILRAWIDQGAAWPETGGVVEKKHWSFQPLKRPEVPRIEGAAGNPIDLFILAKLAEKGLAPSPEADPRTLCRRLYFDVTGLPPTPEEIEAFLAESSRDPLSAIRNLVDQLLASPRYGERWARHWLDVVRFAESDGFETNQPRPNAWPYRDYVIRAFNEDKPFDQFIREQLAGDAFGVDQATGFLVGGPNDRVKSPDPVLTAQQRADELHDIVGTTASAFLGLTVNCARCHNHKFDPIPQTDYYAIKACFAGVQHGERPMKAPDSEKRRIKAEALRPRLAELETALEQFTPLASTAPDAPRRLGLNFRRNSDRFAPVLARKLRFTIEKTTGAEPCIDELEVWSAGPQPRNVALASAGTKLASSGDYAGDAKHQLAHLVDGKYGNDWSWISNTAGRGWVEIEFAHPENIERIVWGRDRESKYKDRLAIGYKVEISGEDGAWSTVAGSADRAAFNPDAQAGADWDSPALNAAQRAEAAKLDQERRAIAQELAVSMAEQTVYAGRFEKAPPTYRLSRGEPMQPREIVAPGGLSEFGGAWRLAPDAPEQERRLALAKWIASPENPLTARVIVNRLWHYHFGTGLVETPSDLGINGGRPSHPELLDWLASEFLARGWRIKELQRLILLSSTYRQASALNPEAMRVDAGARLLWRFPPRRLEAEGLRDSILAASGGLDLRAGGPGFDLFETNTNYVKVYATKTRFSGDDFRRMVYQNKPRVELDTLFGAFDCPDAGQIAPRRTSSTTPLQALNLLNSEFLIDQAGAFAQRLQRDAGPDPASQVKRAFSLAFGRGPVPEETEAAIRLIATHGLPVFCRALYNANEFLTVF
ncbi:MAG: hypothetical protein JWL90_3828 [Chthoniobacteraceae bacterium]|nr:hypothetical protein [Chthoniobacteraceae bacterium]